jgi:integrase/recombinase XerC
MKRQKQAKNMAASVIAIPSLEELVNKWLQSLEADDHARETIRRYKSATLGFLIWYEQEEGRSLMSDLLTLITQVRYRNFLQTTQVRATSPLNGHLSSLRAWRAWLTEQRYLEEKHAKRIKLVGCQEGSSREGRSDDQVNALLRQVQSSSRDKVRNYAILQVLLQTGICLDECSHLMVEDIEFGERSGRVTIRSGKGNKARVVSLNASARQALANYLAPRSGCDPTIKAITQAWPRTRPHTTPIPLWQSQKGGSLTTSAMRQMIDVTVRNAAVRGLVPPAASAHTLRHIFARNYLTEHPGDIVGLTTILGHSSLDTTRIYSQPTVEQLSVRIEQLRQNAYTS